MRYLLLGLFALAGSATTSSSAAPAAPTPLDFTVVTLPTFDGNHELHWTATREEYDAARKDRRFVMRQFTYISDDIIVGAYLYGPPDSSAKSRHAAPVIVFNRGSFEYPHGFAGEMLVMAHRYAEAGFIVVAPQLRGSNGWAGDDELGGAELHDIMNIVTPIKQLKGADSSRLYLAGESRGGAMVYMALRDGFPARAAAVWGAFTELGPLVAPGGPQERTAHLVWPDFGEKSDDIIRTRSAMNWADQIKVPLLIMHGSADQGIPVSQSQRMDAELTRLGKVHKLMVFDGEQHLISGKGAERDAAAINWFKQYH
jgi:dipeptidyl aminopeptidase/acylaminoacyl peptidase